MKRMVKAGITAALFVCAGTAGWLSGYTSQTEREAAPAAMPEERITPDTRVTAQIEFALCSHSIYQDNEPFEGMDRDAFAQAFGGRIYDFSPDEVRAKRVVQDYCPEHLILKADTDGQLKVMRSDENGSQQAVRLTGVFLKDVESASRERAEYGIVLENMAALTKVLAELRDKE